MTVLGTVFRLAVSLCTLNANYDVINGLMRRSLKIHYNIVMGPTMSSVMWGAFCSTIFIFAFFGSLSFYWISKVVSRRKGIIFCQLLFIFSSFLALWSYYDLFELLFFSHAITGFSVGLGVSFLEISDSTTRRCLVKVAAATAWISTVIGSVMASKFVLGSELTWPFLYLFPAVFNMFCLTFYLGVYKETPVYLLSLAETSLAMESIKFYYENSENHEENLEEMQRLHRESCNRLDFTLLETLQDHVGRKYIILSGIIVIAIQFSILWPFTLFGTEIFLRFGHVDRSSSTFIVAIIFIMATLCLPIGFRLSSIFSPRKLLIFSIACLSMISMICSATIFVAETQPPQSWPALLLIVTFSLTLIVHSSLVEPLLSNGLIVIGERRFQRAIFHFASNFTFLSAFLATLLFYPLQQAIGYGVYMIFTAIQLVALGVIVRLHAKGTIAENNGETQQADEENRTN
ncbi:unnamed protein product [Bursaphelenchus xylophilus]|uniref:(pine wood nematode) hypothetical protein n=1 Tax=Bursaphelenchus xylophilus TaxID=6326 RepID=A0A1I7SCA7_BURXY|nr:unnamed protein product [Bursaphelenchus xylophilus]CAG9094459.1 unnamed protein product [Bursaphelenchus xylophilus]